MDDPLGPMHYMRSVPFSFMLVQDPDELFETISQALLNAVDRDALSGWGGVVHVM